MCLLYKTWPVSTSINTADLADNWGRPLARTGELKMWRVRTRNKKILKKHNFLFKIIPPILEVITL
jgi:hypothetical protein